MSDKCSSGKDGEGSGNGLIYLLTRNLFGEGEELTKLPVIITRVPTKFESAHFSEYTSVALPLHQLVPSSLYNNVIYRVIQNDCRGFNNLSYTIHLR